ncbi:phosphopyruvate hydratase [Candidatus Berkelbacteria bacterium]|nr:phosphopyruvate hydratase [Candidatus Berkelbacteria bacterium]
MSVIKSIQARVILDSRSDKTLEVDVWLDDGVRGRASVPAGASTGIHEAAQIKDMDQAKHNVNTLASLILGQDPSQQEQIDRTLLSTDGTEEKSALGGNVILALSLAVCDAAAQSRHLPLFKHIQELAGLKTGSRLPTPMFNIINGGKHADNSLEFQEFMIVPAADERSFREKLMIGADLFQKLRAVLHKMGHSIALGDEGGFAPRLNSNEEALEILVQTIEGANYQPGRDVTLALDIAASSIADLTPVTYPLDSNSYYKKLISTYPISSLEDPLAEEDWQGWAKLNALIGSSILIVGDDLYTTNPKRLAMGIQQKAANAIIIKPDQIGTLTETLQAVRLAERAGMTIIVSHRSGETESTFISDLAVGTGAAFIKTGAPARGERVAKYNQLLRLEEFLQENQA